MEVAFYILGGLALILILGLTLTGGNKRTRTTEEAVEVETNKPKSRAPLANVAERAHVNSDIKTIDTRTAKVRSIRDMETATAEAAVAVNYTDTLPAEFERQEQIKEEAHEILLAQNNLTKQILGKAGEMDFDLEGYLAWKNKYEMDKLDLEKQWIATEQKLKAGFIFQLQAHQHLALMTEYIGKLYDRSRELKLKGRDREFRLVEEHIEFMEADFRGRQGLLQGVKQDNVRGSDKAGQLRGDTREAMDDNSLR